MKKNNQYSFPDVQISSSRWSHYVHLGIMIVAVVVISAVAIFYSLGFQLNWRTGSIHQTGLISLALKTGSNTAQVTINGKDVATQLPYRTAPIFPGSYTVKIQKPGFQAWNRTIKVVANRVNNFRDIVLIKKVPEPVIVGQDAEQALGNVQLDSRDIQIRHKNELWINDTFITRTSQDILVASWYTDRDHVIYQTGKTLWIAATDGLHTQILATVSEDGPIAYAFMKGGQILVYKDAETIKAIQLY